MVQRLLVCLRFSIPVQHAVAIGACVQILRAFHFRDQLRRDLQPASGTHAALDCRKRLILSRGF
jgi:hypothetical protein